MFSPLRLLSLVAGVASMRAAPAPAAAPDAALRLAPYFGDHAVLQRDKPVPVWGMAVPSDSVTVTFHGQTAKALAGPDGNWRLSIGPFEASADGADLVVSGRSTVTLHDVVVGEVWLCSGQSNMEFKVDDGKGYRVDHPEAEVETEPEAVEPAPAPKPRRTRGARKSTTKAATDAGDGDADGSGEEEKG